MKTVVISGAHSNTGKTTLARSISEILEKSIFVKIGTGEENPDSDVPLYEKGTSFDDISKKHSNAEYLIIESNSVVSQITPDLLIYLPGEQEEKESSVLAREKADIIRGDNVTCTRAKDLAKKLGAAPGVFRKILDEAGVKLCGCEFGVF